MILITGEGEIFSKLLKLWREVNAQKQYLIAFCRIRWIPGINLQQVKIFAIGGRR